MDKIRDWLYIGDYTDCLDREQIEDNDISAVLQLSGPVFYPDIACRFIWVEDGMPLDALKLERGLDFIRSHQEQRVLVGCAAGISRSATFCIAALKEIEGLSLEEAYQEVKKARPQIAPHLELWASLRSYFED